MTADITQHLWQLRLAAAKIADDETRQLYLNAVVEIARRVSSGKSLASVNGVRRADRDDSTLL
ncbi:MAG: hypothetical protein JO255_13990 [Alphaproteobacteria bacterium]|nr:hypothetical protein [Alphaproteobacteria bacterium]